MNDGTKGSSRQTFAARAAALARHRTLGVALVGALLLWAGLPPLGLAWLGWIAPVPWLWLARLDELPGRRPYWAVYAGGCVFWLATNHWLRLPHPATSIGWIALSLYLACFAPAIVGLTRVAVRRWALPIVVAGPAVWVGCDQARAYLWTGFSMSSLCHGQYQNTSIIQCADLCGEFGVTFLMVAAAACLARALPLPGGSRSLGWALPAPLIVGAMFAYGRWCLSADDAPPPGAKRLSVALIQGSIESEVKHDPSKTFVIYEHYKKLSEQAVKAAPHVQLVVWPETMFPFPWMTWTDDAAPPPDEDWDPATMKSNAEIFRRWIDVTARGLHKPMLLGIAASHFGPGTYQGYNSALYVDAEGRPLGRYDKRHRVVFGEFIPFADWFPWLYRMTPLTGGIEAGVEAQAFELAGVRFAPNICYESALARVVRRQVVELRRRDREPDLLVNLTNDSWFRGSSELDLHLACGVFRAIECRKPLLIAANTGFSAQIDPLGRIVRQGPRRAEGFLTADVTFSARHSPYLLMGDLLANLCLAISGATAVVGLTAGRALRPAAEG